MVQVRTRTLRRRGRRGELEFRIDSRAIDALAAEVRRRYVGPARTAARQVTAKYARLMLNEARSLCPVDTGNLKASIKLVLEQLAFTIYTEVTYAAFVELGTRRMAAQPFMVPAFRRYARELYDELRAVLLNPTAAGGGGTDTSIPGLEWPGI